MQSIPGSAVRTAESMLSPAASPDAGGGMVRLCVLVNSLAIGGAETQLLRLCRHLPPEAVMIDVVYYYAGEAPLREAFEATPARVTLIDKDALGRRRFIFELARFFRRGRYDVIHCWLGTANQFGVLAAWLAKVPCILTGHRSCAPASRLRSWFDRIVSRWTTGRVVNSEAIRDCHCVNAGYPRDKLFVLHNGMDPNEFAATADPEQVRRQLGVPPRAPLVTTVGRLVAIKNQALFVRAAARVADSRPDAHFLIVGGGPLRESLERLAAERGLPDRIHLPGLRSDVKDLLAASTLTVCTSESEGLPNAVLEAMFLGVPTITTDNGGGPEVLGSPEWVVPRDDEHALAERMARLLDDAVLRADIGGKLRQRARERFGIAASVERYLAILRDAVARCRTD